MSEKPQVMLCCEAIVHLKNCAQEAPVFIGTEGGPLVLTKFTVATLIAHIEFCHGATSDESLWLMSSYAIYGILNVKTWVVLIAGAKPEKLSSGGGAS